MLAHPSASNVLLDEGAMMDLAFIGDRVNGESGPTMIGDSSSDSSWSIDECGSHQRPSRTCHRNVVACVATAAHALGVAPSASGELAPMRVNTQVMMRSR